MTAITADVDDDVPTQPWFAEVINFVVFLGSLIYVYLWWSRT